MLQEILLEFYPDLIETFDPTVLTRLPSRGRLQGIYDPNASQSSTTSSTSTGGSTNGVPDTPTTPTTPTITGPSSAAIIKNFTLRYQKKPATLIPLLDDSNNPITFQELYGNSPDEDALQPQQLQDALNACTRYSDCWGIGVQNTNFGISIQSSYSNYIFTLMKKPTSGTANAEYLTCDQTYYTYLKEDYVKSPAPPDCDFAPPPPPPDSTNNAPPPLPSWWDKPPPKPKTVPTACCNPRSS